MLWSRTGREGGEPVVRAGAVRIDQGERIAWLRGAKLDLSPLLLNLLLCLAERPGRVVTRAELKARLWPYAVRIDTERRLNTAVRALRTAIGGDGQVAVETVRSHGYRLRVRPGRGRIPMVAGAAAMIAATALTLPAWVGPAKAPKGTVALMEAQAAVDAWRQAPNAAKLASADASVTRAERNATEVPALHLLRAQLALEGAWDWAAAEGHYRRALTHDADNTDAQLGLAWLQANRGRRAEALALVEELTARSALTEERRANLGWLLIRLGRADLAAATCRAEFKSSPNLLSCAHVALAGSGRVKEARQAAAALMKRVGASPDAVRDVQSPDAAPGYARFLQWRVVHFLPAEASWFQRAQVLADAGRSGAALDALSRSVGAREPLAVKIASTPSFASLRTNPRFRALAARVGVSV